MSANENFSSVDEELAHFKSRYLELKEEFDEMLSMNKEYEAEMEQQVEELEQKEKTLRADNLRITQELEQYRSKHREKEQTQDSEISRLKSSLEQETQSKVRSRSILALKKSLERTRSEVPRVGARARRLRPQVSSFSDFLRRHAEKLRSGSGAKCLAGDRSV